PGPEAQERCRKKERAEYPSPSPPTPHGASLPHRQARPGRDQAGSSLANARLSFFSPLPSNATVTCSSPPRSSLATTIPRPNVLCRTFCPARKRARPLGDGRRAGGARPAQLCRRGSWCLDGRAGRATRDWRLVADIEAQRGGGTGTRPEGPADEMLRDVAQEARGRALHRLSAVLAPAVGVQQVQITHRPGDTDEEEPPLLLHLRGAVHR